MAHNEGSTIRNRWCGNSELRLNERQIADGSATKVDGVARNTPGELMLLIPAGLASGDYRLEVRAVFGSELRTGALNATLSVA
jgi:hypothetical protein